ncbi:efflux transporter outer membrane subunit [Steroidobacter sp.]|uniref:efflux transporter outer membrane subunit n=1 Tax=Steroidobacter sp. TaxID=1978227 RepID=UPI001A63F47B|nr:efflux transporter outer membrane subunit [Steroidobacter sp.]MBL8267920.1 efflux transporter outer membrane subunit [Steroidobacter sp.]
MRKPTFTLTLAATVSLLLAGCTLAPRYDRPAAPVADTWPTGPAYETAQAADKTAADLPWREFVVDENLEKVIELALTNNRDLRSALASIQSARAQYRIQRADLMPKINGDVSATRAKSFSSVSGTTSESEYYTASVGLSAFEIDLFGRVRSLSNAALESYFATSEAGRATRISLIAETASAYLTLAADNSQLELARRTVESAQRSMNVTRKRLEAGVSSRLDVRQAETIYQQARADLASTTALIAQDRNALELLTGSRVPDELLPKELPDDHHWLADVPAGLSSSVLLTRPDVLQAEHQLKSANANIGAARAAFFPTLSLTASTGLASTELSDLFNNGASVWSVGPSLTLPIFNGGANVANLSYAKAQRDLYVSQYELAIQTAFKEVADALAVRGTIQEQLDAQRALVEAAADSYQLAEARYSKGVDTFLNALDAQRTLYSAEKSLVSARLTASDNVVTLYRVLGGGLAGEE